jgi:phage recombination protein Bet
MRRESKNNKMAKKTQKEEPKEEKTITTTTETPQNSQELTPREEKEIKVIERIIENREIAPQDVFGKITRPQLELIKRTVAKGASDDELRLFIQVCKGANLNPFLRQAHLVPFWDSKDGVERRAVIVGIDGFRSTAESSGAYAGNDDPAYDGETEITYSGGKAKVTVPNKATVTVYKMLEGQKCPFTATARWSEYYPGEKKGFQWHTKPYLMLGKCAESLALRKAFPKLLSGMYSAEEMDKTIQIDDTKKIQNGFKKLMETLQTCTIEQLEDYRLKMEKSDKYTPEQKEEYLNAVENRINELMSQE